VNRTAQQECQPVPELKVARSSTLYLEPADAGQTLDIRPVRLLLVPALREVQNDDGAAGPQYSSAVLQVTRYDFRTSGKEIRKRVDRQDQVEATRRVTAEIASVALLEIDVPQIPATTPRLLERSRGHVDASDRTDMRRESALDATDAAADIEDCRGAPQQIPFDQPGHDLARGAIENLGGAKRIECDRGLRRESDRAVELAPDCVNPVPRANVDQPAIRQGCHLAK